MLPLRAIVDLGAMVMKRLSTFPKAQTLPKPHYQIVLCHISDTHWEEFCSSAEMQSVYSAALPSWLVQAVVLFNP